MFSVTQTGRVATFRSQNFAYSFHNYKDLCAAGHISHEAYLDVACRVIGIDPGNLGGLVHLITHQSRMADGCDDHRGRVWK
ncbi:MAG: hypothetical protein Q9208_001406 [Pyrenodesmia sp. 3 TL-2023]